MSLALHLVRKDLMRKLRSPAGLLIVLSFPVVFAGMIALAFGRGSEGMPRARLLVADEDDRPLSRALASAFTSPQAGRVFDARVVSPPEGRELMERGKASALLVIPEGFTSDLLAGTPITLRLVRNPSEGVLPEIAEQAVGLLADALEGGRRVLDEPVSGLRPFLGEGARAPSEAEVVTAALAVRRALAEGGELIFPPAIALESDLFDPTATTRGGAGNASAIFLLILPGIAVYAIFLVGDQTMRDVMTERTLGTMRRQLAGPVRVRTYVLAKALATAIVSLAALVVLAAIGALALARPIDVSGFLLVSMGLIAAATGASALVYGISRTERQAATMASIVYLVLAFVGGSFFRLETLPPALRAIAPFTPFYWATEGYRTLLEDGAGAADVLLHAGVLAASGLLLLAAGGAALHRAALRGSAA